MQQYSVLDRFVIGLDNLLAPKSNVRPNPASHIQEQNLNAVDTKEISRLLRINHSGEVCAQALYYSQAIFAENKDQLDYLIAAAEDEYSHLTWCQERLHELGARTSFLNPLWATGSYIIGLIAGMNGDQYSNAFIAETECQVSEHLQDHLDIIANRDLKSSTILRQMLYEESEHASHASSRTHIDLNILIKYKMKFLSSIFKVITKYI